MVEAVIPARKTTSMRAVEDVDAVEGCRLSQLHWDGCHGEMLNFCMHDSSVIRSLVVSSILPILIKYFANTELVRKVCLPNLILLLWI